MSTGRAVVTRSALLSLFAFGLLPAKLAQACSTCFGDPDSSLTKGALAGVIVLAVVVYGVLFSFVGIMFSWRRRARALADGQQ